MKTLPPSILTVPNDLSYLPAIQGYTSELAKTMGFPEEEVAKILLAEEEAVVNVVKHAFDPTEAATYEIKFEPSSYGLEIIIKDKGLPFVAEEIPEYATPGDMEQMASKGLGSFLMKRSVDEVVYNNLGREGKELHLVKYFPFKSVLDLHKESELERYPAPEKNVPLQEVKEFEIRLMRPEECPEVSRLFYRAYGYSYGIESIYYPDAFAKLHQEGFIVSVVAATEDRGIVGHLALVRNDLEEKTAEAAMAVVQPDYRGQGIQNLMISALKDQARKIGLLGIYSKAVTNHVYAQKAGLKAGFNRCAIAVGLIPADRSFKGIHSELGQRESVGYGFLALADPPGIVLYPPSHHGQFVEKVCGFIGFQRTFAPADGAMTDEDTSSIKTLIVPSYNRAVIEIHRYGRNAATEIRNVLKDLRLKKIEEITLYLSLEDPLTAVFCKAFEDLGFFIAGILPYSHVGDALILQYLNNVLIDYDRIQVVSEAGEMILAYVRAHDPNIT